MLKRLLCCVPVMFAGVTVHAASPANSYLHAPLAFDRHGENFTARGPGYAIDVNGGGAKVGVPGCTVTLDFAGARKPAAVAGPQLPGKVNYISGKDPAKWQLGLPTYGHVTYPDVYPGIDVVYYGNQEQFEFDLVVKPGADPNAIRMKVGGAEKLSLDPAGQLHIAGGLRIELPKIYQEINGARKSVAGHYALVSRGEIAFQLDAYDKTRPLVVDPTLVYSSYLGGGAGTATGSAIALDSSLNILVAGSTQDQAFPVVSAAYPYSGNNDGFVTKYNPTGTTILYSTYIGGTSNDVLNAIAVDASGNAWAAGYTNSNNFPVLHATQTTYGGGAFDAVLVKLSPAGVPLFSTYLGGGANDQALGVAVDSNSNAYVTGFSNSNNFSTTAGVVQTAHQGGFDVFVEKFNSTATPGRVYSTFLGGANNDEGFAVAADSTGSAYITGFTGSAAWAPANPGGGAHATITGSQNAFVAKLNSAGTALSYFTYFGGGSETGVAIALDSLNNVTIGGQTIFPGLATVGAAQTAEGGGADGYVANLNPAGTAFNWVTYVGGNRADAVKGVSVDGTGNVYITGNSSSTNLPVVSPLQSTIPGTTDTLFQSSDSGANWSVIDSGITDEVYDMSPDPVTSGTVVVSGAGGIFLSTNNGGSWTQELTGVFGALYLARSPATSTTIYAVTGSGGVRLSTNNGVTWTAPGNVGVGVSGVIADPNNASAAYAFGASGVYVTSNSGVTWAPANTGLPTNPNVAAMTAASDGALYIAFFQGIYKSTNQGGAWSPVNSGLPNFFPTARMLTASATTVYVATGNGIFRTTNGGAGWSPTSNPANSTPMEVAAAPGNPAILYTATQDGTIHVSSDGGATWSAAGAGFPPISFTTIELAVDPLDSTHVFAQLLENVVTMVGKLNSTGSAFTYLTYLGSQGSGSNRGSTGNGIAADNAGDAFIVGAVSSDNFLITPDTALQTSANNTAAFLAEISDSAGACAYPASPQAVVIPAFGFDSSAVPGGLPIVEPSGCAWTAGSTQSWAVVSGSGTGIGFINIVSIAANTTGAARTASLTLNGNAYANITQPDVSCNYSVDQSVYPVSAAGGTFTAALTTGTGCPWEVTNRYPAGVSTTTPTGTGSATLSFTVAANGGTLARDFFLSVGPDGTGTQVHVSQGTLQTISFGALSNVTFGMPPTTIGATASSGLTVSFVSNTSAVCVASGVTITFFAPGTCSITASQNGDMTHAAATPVSQSFTVLAAQTIAFGAISPQVAGTAALALNASASSGLPVTFASNSTDICSLSGNMLTPVAAGTCSITATQPGDNVTYGPAAPVTVTFTVDTTFGDVSTANESQAFITAIDDMLSKGITSGCTASPLEYCPTLNVTRGQMAVFIIRSIYGSNNFSYNPTPYFSDATVADVGSFFPYVQKMHELGITSGCTTTTYCPDLNVTRGQMAVFIIRARYGTSFNFDFPATPLFTDATTASVGSFFKYIQRMKVDNITSGCTTITYCPDLIVTRDQMAVFMIRGGFNQLLPPTEPIIGSGSPATGGLGETIKVTLTGVNTHFVQDTTKVSAGAGLTVGSVTVNSATSLTVPLTIAANATPNPVSLLATTVGNAGAEEAVLPNGFTITSDPAAGLAAYWTGNNTTADTVSTLNGTLVNGAAYASASSRTLGLPDAQAFFLNGTNSYVQAAAGETGTLTGARTLAAWVYPNASAGAGMPILTGGSTLASSDVFGITGATGTCSSGGQYQLYIDHAGTTCYVSDTSLAPGVWSLVVVTFDGSKVVFYIDGVPSVTVPAAQMSNYGLATLELGGNTLADPASAASFNGLLSEVQVYNRALTPAEIQGLYVP